MQMFVSIFSLFMCVCVCLSIKSVAVVDEDEVDFNNFISMY